MPGSLPLAIATTPEEQKKIQRYYVHMNLLNMVMFSNNYKRIIRITKVITKLDRKNQEKIVKQINGFRERFVMSIEQAQNFLTTGLLIYDLPDLGRRYSRVEIEEALENLAEEVFGIATETISKAAGDLIVQDDDEEADIL